MKIFIALALSIFLTQLVACDDDSSSSPVTPSDSKESSSSIDSANSSSSVKNESSSSVETASSSSVLSSSSWSSEGTIESSSSFEDELNCSALLEGEAERLGLDNETEWNWNVPKACRFNPNITYGTMTDSRDKKVYKTVKIGTQTWMAENLNYADSSMTPSLLNRSWCHSNDSANCAVAGRLYTWAAAIDSVALYDGGNGVDCGCHKTCTLPDTVYGICPPGWHLPTQAEWDTLLTAVGGSSIAGTKLKSQTGWCSNGNGTDTYGFSGLPAGLRYYNGDFYDASAGFWSATQYTSNDAYCMSLDYIESLADLTDYYKSYGYSVRCLKDSDDDSSSSVTPKSSSSDTRVSSSSFSAKSSSSNEPESAEASSSSLKNQESSSSVKIEMYSSSEKFVDSSGSEKVEESSSSLQNTSPDSSYFNAEKNTLTDFRNGQIYKTATIGNQIWMAENLNYEVDGQSYCYNNSADSCAKYGRLYTWAAAVGKSEEECGNGKTCGLSGKVRGVCPEGWYLPSDSEWSSLYSAMGRSPYAMQAKGFANWPDATDAYGFSALPTGHYIDGKYDRGFFGVGYYAYFWGSTEGDSSSAYRWNIRANGTTFYEYHYDVKYAGLSVRCLKDEETP